MLRSFEIGLADAAEGLARIGQEGLHDHRPPAASLESERFVARAVRISETREARRVLATVVRRVLFGALPRRNQANATSFELIESSLHLNQVLTTKRSAEVAEKVTGHLAA